MSTSAIDRLVGRVVSEGILCREEILVHHSKQDDMLRKELKHVQYLWVGYPLVCYSPTVESGVDFSEEHFHKMYIYACRQSTSHFGLWQMSGRVRKLGNPTILCCAAKSIKLSLLPQTLRFTTRERMQYIQWTENEIRAHLALLRVEEQDTILDVPVESALLAVIAGNDAMHLNSQIGFYREFKALAEGEGHIVKKADDSELLEFNQLASPSEKVRHLLDDVDLSHKEFLELYGKVVTREATEEEHWAVYKHEYKISWGIDRTSSQFVEQNGSELAGPVMEVISQVLFPKQHPDRLPLQCSFVLKAKLVSEILACLGFKHPFDVQHRVSSSQLLVLESHNGSFRNISSLMQTRMFTDYNKNIKLFSAQALTTKDWSKLRSVTDTLKLVLGSAAISFKQTGDPHRRRVNGQIARETMYGLDEEESIRVAELVRLRIGRQGTQRPEDCSSRVALEFIKTLEMKNYGDLTTTDWFEVLCDDAMLIEHV